MEWTTDPWTSCPADPVQGAGDVLPVFASSVPSKSPGWIRSLPAAVSSSGPERRSRELRRAPKTQQEGLASLWSRAVRSCGQLHRKPDCWILILHLLNYDHEVPAENVRRRCSDGGVIEPEAKDLSQWEVRSFRRDRLHSLNSWPYSARVREPARPEPDRALYGGDLAHAAASLSNNPAKTATAPPDSSRIAKGGKVSVQQFPGARSTAFPRPQLLTFAGHEGVRPDDVRACGLSRQAHTWSSKV